LIFYQQERYQQLKTRLYDIQAALELLETESDEHLEQELQTNYEFLSSELKHVEIISLLNQPFDDKGAFMTVTAGNDDLDSLDWVEMLQRIYANWCKNHDCKLQLLDESIGEFCGFNYVTLKITGNYAYGYLKLEQGIHQLRRISPFPKKSTIINSFAKVEVTPILDETVDFKIPMQDLEFYVQPSNPNSNRISLIVKATHIPTGISFTSRDRRSQLQNKEQALSVVKSKLFSLIQTQGVALKDVKKPSPKKVANNPIREYIFHPYQKIKDLRTNIETSNIEEVMKGNLDLFTKAYLKQTY